MYHIVCTITNNKNVYFIDGELIYEAMTGNIDLNTNRALLLLNVVDFDIKIT